MRKIIFLDIDGVVFIKGKFINLDILNKTGAEVVIISSWGRSCEKPLKEAGLTLPIIDYIDTWNKYRGLGVSEWLENNIGIDESYNYVILDDCPGEYLIEQADYIISPDPEIGLTEDEILFLP